MNKITTIWKAIQNLFLRDQTPTWPEEGICVYCHVFGCGNSVTVHAKTKSIIKAAGMKDKEISHTLLNIIIFILYNRLIQNL